MRIVLRALRHMLTWGIVWGTVLGAVYGTLIYPIAGTLYGGFFGGAAGLILGILTGLAVGLVTRWFFSPLTDLKRYRWTLAIVCAALGFGGALIGFAAMFNFGVWDFFVIPSLIAAAMAVYASQRFATWYAGQKRAEDKPKRDEIAYYDEPSP